MGVVLTAETPGRASLEVVYMGVSPPWRGKGVGDMLLMRAVQRARALRLNDITLAVDGINVAARRLYERWSFVETARRRAWITTPSKRA
jgi:GNAT superfamily N-acetyltransferase